MSEFVIGSLDYEFTEGGPRPGAASRPGAGRGAARHSPSSEGRSRSRGYEKLSPDFGASGIWTDAPLAVPRPRGTAQSRSRSGLILSILSILVLLCALTCAVLPTLKINRIEVRGNSSLSASDVMSAALIHGNEYFLKVNTGAMEKALLSSPSVETADVQRIFPGTIRITISERKPVAVLLVSYNGRLEPVYCDAGGKLFALASGSGKLRNDLPVVSGFQIEGFTPGMDLPPAYSQIFKSLSDVEASAPALLGAFSEIRAVRGSGAEPELILYPLHHRLPVRTGAVLNETTLRSIILVLDVLGPQNSTGSIAEIDFRTGTVVYRVKEGQSG